MEKLAESDIYSAHLDPRGFVEFVVKDAQELRREDLDELAKIIRERRIAPAHVLINRLHDYSAAPSVLTSRFQHLPLHVDRVAYLVYASTTERVSEYVADVVLHDCPHEIFRDRDAAIAWLLADR
jgi:hypothetical protein